MNINYVNKNIAELLQNAKDREVKKLKEKFEILCKTVGFEKGITVFNAIELITVQELYEKY